jgi:hypothetical protein
MVKKWPDKTNTMPGYDLTLVEIEQINGVYHALKLCDRYVFWKTECYTLALSGKIILGRRNILSTLHRVEKDHGKTRRARLAQNT